MSRVVVIGGGASGLVAAIQAAKNNNKVTLIEKNNNLGKKILVTGNGKCNYWNKDISIEHYNTKDNDILEQILTKENKLEIESFFEKIGIVPKIKDGLYYPNSNQATSIQTALILETQLQGVEIITNEEVLSLTKDNNKFIIETTNQKMIANKVIISTGSKACPKTGSDGLGYELATSLGHSIIKPLPALVQLKANTPFLKEWQGIRVDAEVSLYEDNKLLKQEIGEVQLTNYGISGVCIFQLSSLVSRGLYNNQKEQIQINFLKPININNEQEFINWIEKRNNIVKNRNISELLDGVLNYKLINLILKLTKIPREYLLKDISTSKKEELGLNLTKFKLDIIDTNSFDNAQTCTGGIPLNEINPNTMESIKQKNLYITGELLDADGECGGFNLGFAWITGYLAGTGVNND